MLRKLLSLTLIACGMAILLASAGALGSPGVARAQAVPAPSPRPALPNEDDGSSDGAGAAEMGHITGTVIDLTTGAPIAGIGVSIDGTVVPTDANGNYDLWLPAGSHSVDLVLDSGRGTAAQGPQVVEVRPGERIVQHMSFHSPAPVAATPEPAAPAPEQQPASPAGETKAGPAPAAPEAATPEPEPAPEATAPTRLPRTGDEGVSVWFWMSLGMALVMGGVMIGMRADSMRLPALALANYAKGARANAPASDAAALLAALLTTEIRVPRQVGRDAREDDSLLRALLAADVEKRHAAQDLLAELLSRPVGDG